MYKISHHLSHALTLYVLPFLCSFSYVSANTNETLSFTPKKQVESYEVMETIFNPNKAPVHNPNIKYVTQKTKIETHINLGAHNAKVNNAINKNIWKTDALSLVGMGVTMHYKDEFILNSDIWFDIIQGSSRLSYDKSSVENLNWSHSTTSISEVFKVDLNLEIQTALSPIVDSAVLIGYAQDTFLWEEKEDFTRNPNTSTTFRYEQTWKAPYLGIKLHKKFTQFDINTKLLYSPLVSEKAISYQRTNDHTDKENFDNSTMFVLDLGYVYHVNKTINLKANYRYQKYATRNNDIKGKEVPTDLLTSMFYISINYTY